MIRRRPTTSNTIERNDTVTTDTLPPELIEREVEPAAELPKWQRPSSFSSRKAERAARGELSRPQRLVSLGWVKMPLETHSRDPKRPITRKFVEFEQLYDLDHPLKRYRRFRDGMVEPYDYSTGKTDESVSLGEFDPKNGSGYSAWPKDDRPTTVERIG